MPTSTVWRRRPSSQISRDISPVRPSVDIERLSPEPIQSSPTFDHNASARSNNVDHRPYGLGLSGTSPMNETAILTHHDHIHLDQNRGAHGGAKVRTASHHGRGGMRGARKTDTRQTSRSSALNKTKSHTRSGSTIDDLANAAIATSPTFSNGSPPYAFGSPVTSSLTRPATSYMNAYSHDDHSFDRPSKRIKSEKLFAMEWSPRTERPRTSHAYDYQSPRQEDAELLLSLTYGHSWVPQASPIPPRVPIVEQLPTNDSNCEAGAGPDTSEEVSIHIPEVQMEIDAKPIPEQVAEVAKPPEAEPDANHVDVSMKDAPMSPDDSKSVPALTNDTLRPTATSPEPANNRTNSEEPPIEKKDDTIIASPDLRPAEQLQQGVLEMPAEVELTATPIPKKQRKIQPEVQAEVCASCQRLQRDSNDDDKTTHWFGCEHCKKWYHAACAGFKDKQEERSVDKFFCQDCEPQHGKTTFVRKSSRARTAIDYAGLNQGVIKPSDTSTMHHYIQPIKDGRIKVLPDDFARVRPELLTADFWESMDGMKRPFVVPTCWNPRFGANMGAEGQDSDRPAAEPLDDGAHVHYDKDGTVMQKTKEISNNAEPSDHNATNLEEVMDCDQDYLGMVMPRDLTVRKVAELFGPHEPVPVIDVKSQETKGAFTLGDWAEYYELAGEKPIRNVISLEVSKSRLGRLIRRPKVVCDIDLEDHVWDHESRSTSNKRPVQFYCLMSVADSYTDFHIDFGGSSVYYHILKGVKTFFMIPPEDKYLKKYEEWCNSDTQNETWLGDLCGGNVTRVDLHEGDTAFIPAGWIHSVWTPEDSLVIGGNFLTHLDYELQFKVANIEKTTNVPLKFRYPFFQKVMWFTLFKYLEDDPLPEEVLRDFDEDTDYRFLRANPIWHELGELVNTAEPGDVEYNARMYPKSELRGLPALRDYLYRTARIHADLPVPDINKRQIEAVKGSIPKGYGDPMQLVKSFAVWCAWKIGNETVPEWVHADVGLAPELKEREKRKAEVFRVPPERVSARKASQAPSVTGEDTVTNTNKHNHDSEAHDTAKGSKLGSKLTGLKVACEPCRKRRIKCRHKDGDISPSSASPAAIRPRTYSNVSVDIPKLASASPVLNGYETAPVTNGIVSDFGNTSDLAQAALASLHSQSSDPAQASSTSINGSASKKGRSKACEECRKSKRRCVHDEYGRVDPAKAAEPAKPRGSATKRASRPSEEGLINKVKLEGDIDPALIDPIFTEMSHTVNMDENIDPALMNDQHLSDQSFEASNPCAAADDLVQDQMGDIGQDYEHMQLDEMEFTNAESGVAISDPVDPDLESATLAMGNNPEPILTAQVASLRQTPDLDLGFSPITVDSHLIETTEKSDVEMTDVLATRPISRHSSRQPKMVDRFVPEAFHSPSRSIPRPVKSEQRDSSSVGSENTIEVASNKRRSSSNTSATIHQAMGATMNRKVSRESSARPVSRGSTAGSDHNGDERMARELQAAENGLRRRTSVRA